MPEAYERWLAPAVFHPFAVELAGRVAARRPGRVLELAAGTGVLTRELLAALPGADVTATDLNAAMVDFGRGRAPGATWRQADAMNLPFDAGWFDAVACQFGVMFFPDKPAAFAEARRVLTPEGRLVVNTWAEVARHEFAAGLVAALEERFPDDVPGFLSAVPHGYADVDAVVADLEAAGLDCLAADTVTLDGWAGSIADVAAGFCTGTPLRAEIEVRDDLVATTAAVTEAMQARFGSGPVTGRMTAHVIEARPRHSRVPE
jgi:SAM-dependent methyltransferase